MEIVELVDSDGKTRRTTKTAWEHKPEQNRLKSQGWKLAQADARLQVKPETEPAPVADAASVEESKPKTSKKNGTT